MIKDAVADIAFTCGLLYVGYRVLSGVSSKIIAEIEPDFIKNVDGNFNLLPHAIASDATPEQVEQGLQSMYEMPPLI